MLDVRLTGLTSPAAEVEFASVELSATARNFGDGTATITGTFRVYRQSTGAILHTSVIASTTIGPGETVQLEALTPFDPPAPADQDYFVLASFDVATPTPPYHKPIFWRPTYFDVKPVGMGPAPAAHHATHEDGGSDELDLAGLSGLLADPQTPTTHATTHESGGTDPVDHSTLDNLPFANSGHTGFQGSNYQTLVEGFPNVPWDCSLGRIATLTMTGNDTLELPSNCPEGSIIVLHVFQDAVGGWTLSFTPGYIFPGGVPPVIPPAANSHSVLVFIQTLAETCLLAQSLDLA